MDFIVIKPLKVRDKEVRREEVRILQKTEKKKLFECTIRRSSG